MANTSRQYALGILSDSREKIVALLADIPQDELFHRPLPGANHALWVIGHLAATDDLFAGLCDGGGRQLPERYSELFGIGSQPMDDPASYPAVAEVRKHLEATRQRLQDGFQAASEAVLAEPLPEEFQRFASDKLAMLLRLAWHEGLHAGQLTVIRKSLGIAPTFG